jgi:hypothetical protein
MPLHVVNVTWTDLRALACIRNFWNQFWIAGRWIWSFWEAMEGITVRGCNVCKGGYGCCCCWGGWKVSSYTRYSNGLRTLPWGMPVLTGDRVWCVEAILTKNCLLCK